VRVGCEAGSVDGGIVDGGTSGAEAAGRGGFGAGVGVDGAAVGFSSVGAADGLDGVGRVRRVFEVSADFDEGRSEPMSGTRDRSSTAATAEPASSAKQTTASLGSQTLRRAGRCCSIKRLSTRRTCVWLKPRSFRPRRMNSSASRSRSDEAERSSRVMGFLSGWSL
jgi:hypothetical protein